MRICLLRFSARRGASQRYRADQLSKAVACSSGISNMAAMKLRRCKAAGSLSAAQ
jgi:hypothetical protein